MKTWNHPELVELDVMETACTSTGNGNGRPNHGNGNGRPNHGIGHGNGHNPCLPGVVPSPCPTPDVDVEDNFS